jgi:hypothetical protein
VLSSGLKLADIPGEIVDIRSRWADKTEIEAKEELSDSNRSKFAGNSAKILPSVSKHILPLGKRG